MKTKKETEKAPPTDREWLLQPNLWPKWPVCPLKKTDGSCALVFGDPAKMGNTWHVWFVPNANIWHMDDETIRKGSYEPLDKILADGWVVD
jgi:hypothetical protein